MGGRGVFLCIKKYSQVLEEPQLDVEVDLMWVKLPPLNQSPIHIMCFYRPPNADSHPIEQLHLSITNLLSKSNTPPHILLMGDFQFFRYYLEWWLWSNWYTNLWK